MRNRKENVGNMKPTIEQLEKELARTRHHRQYMNTLRNTIFSLIAVAAVVLLAVMWLPVLRISGNSMADTLSSGDIVVTMRTSEIQKGDLVVFSGGSGKLLIKRVIAEAGDEVNILSDGTVMVNGEEIEEDYVKNKARGEFDIELPYVVPEGRIFVLGDNRSVSVDSRNSALGCIAEEQIIGKALLRIWPLEDFGMLLSMEQNVEG